MRRRVLGKDMGFTEGPVFTRSGATVVVSIDRGRLYRIGGAGPEVLAEVGGGPNGAAEGGDGNIYVAQNGGRMTTAALTPDRDMTGGVQIVTPDGSVAWLTRDPIAPNDLCFGPDGLLYVTDPTRRPSRDDGRLWRCDPRTGAAELLVSVHWYPNGIGFGREDEVLYVASTGEQQIKRFPLLNGRLGAPVVAVQMTTGRPDGFVFDVDGNLIVCAVSATDAPGEIQTWSPEGRLLDVFRPGPGRRYTNAALSPDRVLVVTDSDGGRVLAFDPWPAAGLPLHPFRA